MLSSQGRPFYRFSAASGICGKLSSALACAWMLGRHKLFQLMERLHSCIQSQERFVVGSMYAGCTADVLRVE